MEKTSEPQNKYLYNSRITNTYLKLVRKRYSYINIDDLLRYAGMELHQVNDEGHWFTQEQVSLFNKRLRELTGNEKIAREAGVFSASPEELGGIKKYLLGLVSPARAYALVGSYTKKFTRSSVYQSNKIGPNKVEVLVIPNEGIIEEPFQCENRQGYFEAISRLFNYKLPKIEHPECMFRGGKVCRYIVSWQRSRSLFWKRIRNLSALFVFLFCLISLYIFNSHQMLTIILPISVSVIFLLSWYAELLDNRELQAAVKNLEGSNDELIEQINVNYENALMINEIGQALSKESDIDGVLANVIEVLKKRLDFDRGLVMLANPKKTRLYYRAGFGYSGEQYGILRKTAFHLDRSDSQGMFVVSFRDQVPILLNDLEEVKDSLSPRSYEFARRMGVKSFICCPIVYEGESLGVLAVDNVKTKRPLLQRDINLLMGVAPQIAISIHSIKLIEARLRHFRAVLQVLVASTDARDPITAGHSEMVTEYAVGICRELGLDKDYCEMIRVASLLHDYGKIGVDDSILKKPGRLTAAEYDVIKTHAIKTRNILSQINFEGIYKQVPIIAGAHHEKIDGSGYPMGLSGDAIPLGAKIIAVADVFEAVTSKRHYRDPMPVHVAFELLRDKAGIHFDNDCIRALSNFYHTNAERLAKRETIDLSQISDLELEGNSPRQEIIGE